MPARPNILLLGLRASGKSTVGRLLASRLSLEFIDLDDLTAAELGTATAGAALASHGEPRFRAAEAVALGRALEGTGQIIALGGGTPTGSEARELIERSRAAGTVLTVYLETTPTTLQSRLAADATLRPSLTGRGTVEEVAYLHAVRDPIYRVLADHIVDASIESPEALAERISALALMP